MFVIGADLEATISPGAEAKTTLTARRLHLFRSTMMHVSHIAGLVRPLIGPLTLAERLINLAADADDAGFPVAAEHLIHLADQVLNRPAELGF